MKEPILVIMAAGMGSRYGGLKQIDPVDEQGNLIIDFSIYDAIQAGFKKVIFIITHEIEHEFKERIGERISKYINVDYVFQELSYLPKGFQVPEGRAKPWGTGHAILCCKDKIDGPFAVINSDDYYGKDAFRIIYESLVSAGDNNKYQYSMVGYQLGNTLTEYGHVSRGVCLVSEVGTMRGIQERTHIEKRGKEAAYTEDGGATWVPIKTDATVSMNMWGFTQSILSELQYQFIGFLEHEVIENPLKSEYFLPAVVGKLLEEQKAVVTVLFSKEKWFGVTYKEDKENVVNAIKQFKAAGLYPECLWL